MKPAVYPLAIVALAVVVFAIGFGGVLAVCHAADWYARMHGWTGMDAQGGFLAVFGSIFWIAVYGGAVVVAVDAHAEAKP